MKKTIAKIGSILILIILLPTIFFSAYEITNLNNNEQVIDSIYSSQLSSIVFSLNEYSSNAISWWANTIDKPEIEESASRDSLVKSILFQYNSIESCFFISDNIITEFYSKSTEKESLKESFQTELYEQNIDLERILKYIKSGYRKIQPIDIDIANKSLIVFALNNSKGSGNICGIWLDSDSFINEKLRPKIQGMTQDKFIISVFDKSTKKVIYSNELFDDDDNDVRILEQLWLFPNLEIGIQLKGDPIEQLVNKRARTSTVLIIIMDIILLLGAWFVYRNIRQEIKLAQIKSDFVANVSHEIKTPLALINMYSETLEMGRVSTEEKKKEYITVIQAEAKRLSSMVNKILSFSKIENGKREYNFIETDLNQVVSQIIETYKHHFNNKGFNYKLNLCSEPLFINGDAEALTDAINNLIDNAIKYSGNEKVVEINTNSTDNSAFVEVKDFGIGIAQKDQQYIFDKFYRVSTGNLAYKAKGSGIGLSIVKHIVDAHKGRISVQSALQKGSSFKLIFPLVK